jgi:hypothetical protein
MFPEVTFVSQIEAPLVPWKLSEQFASTLNTWPDGPLRKPIGPWPRVFGEVLIVA